MDKVEDLKPEGRSEKIYYPETISDAPLLPDGGNVIRDASGNKVVDELGLVSSNAFAYGSYNASSLISISAQNTYNDVSGSSLTLTLARKSRVLFILSTVVIPYLSSGSGIGNVTVALTIDGVVEKNYVSYSELMEAGALGYTGGGYGTHLVKELTSGVHTVKIQWKTTGIAGTDADMKERSLTYLVLGS